jgi:hypothetical protein
MNAIIKGAIISSTGAVLLGASLTLSSATAVSGASRIHLDKSSIKCSKSGQTAFCFTVQNTGSGNAIEGEANSGTGVYGSSSTGDGVNSFSTSGAGVAAISLNGPGLSANSTYGVGVSSQSSSGDGVDGISSSGYGVYGYSSSYVAGYFENDAGSVYTVYAQNDAAGGPPLVAYNSRTSNGLEVDAGGDGTFSGSVTAYGGYKTGQRARGGLHVEAFSPESTRATIEDTGTARLESGEGAVRSDSVFASAIDAARDYQVFLTPGGDTRGLYVAAKYEGGFIVRENERGRSSVYFDYRVVAHPYGASDARLPQLTVKPLPVPRLPRHAQPRQP